MAEESDIREEKKEQWDDNLYQSTLAIILDERIKSANRLIISNYEKHELILHAVMGSSLDKEVKKRYLLEHNDGYGLDRLTD